MAADVSAKKPLATVASWVMLLVAFACLAFVAWYIPTDRQRFSAIFRDFDMELPSWTILMLSISDVAFPLAAGVIASASLALQWCRPTRSSTVVFHLFVIVLCCAALVAHRECLFQPMSALIRAVSDGK